MHQEIIGRDDELSVVDAFLATVPSNGPVLVVEGEPGIGKTTIWARALTVASGQSYRVLSCAPVEAESDLSFSGLADLLDDVFGEVAPKIPEPQARAVAVALRRLPTDGGSPDQFAIRSGVVSVLRALAEDDPILVAVDDVQWLDRASGLALAFAGRRVRDAPVAFLLTRRGGDDELPLGLAAARSEREIARLRLRPLSLGATAGVLRAQLRSSIRRSLLRRIYDTAAGNPFFALELARELAVRDANALTVDDPLPVPPNLEGLVRGRLSRLSPRTNEIMLAVSCLAEPTPALLEQAYGQLAPSAIEEATKAGILEHDREPLRFTHPLLASVYYASARATERRRTHGHVARFVADAEEQARHLALSIDIADDDIAQTLEDAAERAAARGAPEAAADLAALAVERTRPVLAAELVRRMLSAGSYALRSGDADRARAALGDALSHASSGPERVEALVRLAESEEVMSRKSELCAAALAEHDLEAAAASRIHRQLVRTSIECFDGEGALHHAETAIEFAELARDEGLLVISLTEAAEAESRYGSWDEALGLLRRSLALEANVRAELRSSPRLTLARFLTFEERFDEARPIYAELLDDADERGDEWARQRIVWNLAWLESDAGEFADAHRRLSESLELAEAATLDVVQTLARLADTAAHLGRVEEARAAAERGLALPGVRGAHGLYFLASLGFLELSVGDLRAAVRQLRAADTFLRRSGRDGEAVPCWTNEVEALVGLGEVERARALLQDRASDDRYRLPGQLASAGRARGLVLAVEGDVLRALDALETALADHARSANPFERARTLLCYGATLRRSKRRRDAGEALGEALGEFERLSTPLWAGKARGELARIGGRRTGGGLTETERRLAELVAEGRSNKEIAAALFVTPKTVSTKLSRIYAKLDVHSRTELVRHVVERTKV